MIYWYSIGAITEASFSLSALLTSRAVLACHGSRSDHLLPSLCRGDADLHLPHIRGLQEDKDWLEAQVSGTLDTAVVFLVQALSDLFLFSHPPPPPTPLPSLSLSLSLCCQDLSEAGGSRVERGSDGYLHFREEIEQS